MKPTMMSIYDTSQLSRLNYTIFNIFTQDKTVLLHRTRGVLFNYS